MTKQLFQYRLIVSTILFLIFASANFSQTIIVNKSNPIESINKSKLRNIFIGNTITWQNSIPVQIADYPLDSELRENFSNRYLSLSARKISVLWVKVSLSWKSLPPKILRDESEVVDYVSKNQGAIGYIDSKIKIPSDVKVLQIK